MANNTRLEIAKDLIESGKLETFKDIFLYAYKTDFARRLGINYTRFLNLVKNPKRLRYEETIGIANILKVDPRLISTLVHNQLEAKKKK